MKKIKNFVIGIDGGGTKTNAVLADLNGKILKTVKTGPSNLRNSGIENAVLNIADAIKKLNVSASEADIMVVIGLAGIQEEYADQVFKIRNQLLETVGESFKGKIKIVSDQLIAFKSGTDLKDGMVLIAGTGSACHGWYKNKEVKTSGWGWLGDEGAGFWAGQKAFQAILKDLDGRSTKTEITKLCFKELKIKTKQDLLKKIYTQDFVKNVSLLSVFVDKASQKQDKIAKNILKQAGQELALSGIAVIKKLKMQKKEFPFVLIGGMFKSKIVLNIIKKEIKKVAPKIKFIQPKKEPVIGAVKLALS